MLRLSKGLVSKHFGDCFQGNSIGQGDGGGKGVSGNVEGEFLVYPAQIGNFL